MLNSTYALEWLISEAEWLESKPAQGKIKEDLELQANEFLY